MALSYTITDLPALWPGKRTAYPKKSPFKSQYTRTMRALERELKYLGAKKVELAMELPRGAMDVRQDGMLKADARPKRALILSFLDSDGTRHAYPCDNFGWWEDNLHAIAVVLEDLRRSERYGIQSALLRAGFKVLTSGTAPLMSNTAAADTLAEFSDSSAVGIVAHADVAKGAARTAIHRTHPDRNGGDRTAFDRVDAARKVLSSHHGVSL